jgi:hypothetical protein
MVAELFPTLVGLLFLVGLFLVGTARVRDTSGSETVATSVQADLSDRLEAMHERDPARKGDG